MRELMEKGTGKTFKRNMYQSLIAVVLISYAVFTLFPVYMGFLNSFKTDGEILTNILAFPKAVNTGNYAEAFEKTSFPRSLFNTILIAGTGISGIIIFGSMAGYKLARTSGVISSVLFGLFVMSMLIPFHSIMITLTRVARELRLQGSQLGLGIIYMGLGVPMSIFLYHGFVKSISLELEEAAVIDGCGDFQLFFRIVFPLLRPITATITILNALWIWNDFLLPLLMLTDSDTYTILLSINMLFGEYNNNDWSAILAALILAVVPVIILYLFLQKQIVRGISDGAIKG